MPRDYQKDAEANAKARALTGRHGSSLVLDALSENPFAAGEIAATLEEAYKSWLDADSADHAALGRIVANAVDDYALQVAEKNGWVDEALADIHEAEREAAEEARADEAWLEERRHA